MLTDIKVLLQDYEINPIMEQNFSQVFAVYASNEEFFLITEGKPPVLAECLTHINAVPDGYNSEDKLFMSIKDGSKILAILDILPGYPTKGYLWIGLLLVHGDCHRQKAGDKIVCAVLDAAKNNGYQGVQLGVIETNAKGLAFWQKMGFQDIQVSQRENKKVIVMEHRFQ